MVLNVYNIHIKLIYSDNKFLEFIFIYVIVVDNYIYRQLNTYFDRFDKKQRIQLRYNYK